jgi:two-component system sensor histidine kinase YesM
MKTGGNLVPLSEELEYLKAYLELQKLRYADRLEVAIHVDVDASSVYCLKFLLEPLIENAVVHGIEKTSSPVRVCIRAFAAPIPSGDPNETEKNRNTVLILEVRDNGRGMTGPERRALETELSSWQESDRSHVGLRNVHGRIKLAFGDPYGVCLAGEGESGFTVHICIPYMTAPGSALRL